MSGHESSTPHIVLMSSECGNTILTRQIPQAYSPIVTCAHERGQIGQTPFRCPDGLFVLFPCLEDCPRVYIKNLDSSCVSGRYEDSPVPPDFSTMRGIVDAKTTYCLGEFAGTT